MQIPKPWLNAILILRDRKRSTWIKEQTKISDVTEVIKWQNCKVGNTQQEMRTDGVKGCLISVQSIVNAIVKDQLDVEMR